MTTGNTLGICARSSEDERERQSFTLFVLIEQRFRRILETQKKLNQRESELKASKAELASALKKAEEVEK